MLDDPSYISQETLCFAYENKNNAGRLAWTKPNNTQLSHDQRRNKPIYYMALSHKDWEPPNPRIWLAETDIDRGLDFPI